MAIRVELSLQKARCEVSEPFSIQLADKLQSEPEIQNDVW